MYYYRYRLKQGLPNSSPLQVIRNYQNAARAVGGKVLFDNGRVTTIRLTKGDKESVVGRCPLSGV